MSALQLGATAVKASATLAKLVINACNLSLAARQPSQSPGLWLFHVSAPLYDSKGSDIRILRLLEVFSRDYEITYFGQIIEVNQRSHHLAKLSQFATRVHTPLTHPSAAIQKELELQGPCSYAILDFYPTTTYWNWLVEALIEMRSKAASCEVVILVDEVFWARWRTVQQDAAVEMRRDFPWITSRWDLLKLTMLNFLKHADILAFVQEDDVIALTDELPRMVPRSGVVPYHVRIPQVHAEVATLARQGMLFLSSDGPEYVMPLWRFFSQLLPALPDSIGDFNIVGAICRYNASFDSLPQRIRTRLKFLGYRPDEELDRLEQEVVASVNPLAVVGGISTKVLRSLTNGLPSVMTFQAAPEHYPGFQCGSSLPICQAGDVACFSQHLQRLASDRYYWEQVARCSRDFVARHFSEAEAERAIALLLPHPTLKRILPGESLRRDGLYIAALLKDISPRWTSLRPSLEEFILKTSLRRPVFVAIYSSNNADDTAKLLLEWAASLSRDGVRNWVTVEANDSLEILRTNRVAFLAKSRNHVLSKLTGVYSQVMFLNDIITTSRDLTRLLHTSVSFDMACAMDFVWNTFELLPDLRCRPTAEPALDFYDIWVARDIEGDAFASRFPFVQHPRSREALMEGRPFQVYSCWNGAVVFNSSVFLSAKLRFRAPMPHECPVCEAQLIPKDMWDLGFTKVYVNPTVQVAYDPAVYQRISASPYYQRFSDSVLPPFPDPVVTSAPERDYCCKGALEHEPDWRVCYHAPNFHRKAVAVVGNVIDSSSFSEVNYAMWDSLHSGGGSLVRPVSSVDGVAQFVTDSDKSPAYFDATIVDPTMARALRFDEAVHCSWPTALASTLPAKRQSLVFFWEICSLPRSWIASLNQFDTIWTPTTFLRECFERAGIHASRIHLLPMGIKRQFFLPRAPRPSVFQKRPGSFRFLFVGGILPRKGIDVMLEAYRAGFTAQDAVCLTVVSGYWTAEYHLALDMLESWEKDPNNPCLEWRHNVRLPDEELLDLYASADAYLALYRAEGLGLPALQAMAMGVPLVVTRGGASDDYANDETAFLVNSTERTCTVFPCNGTRYCVFDSPRCLEMTEAPSWREPDLGQAKAAMKFVFEHPEERKRRATAGRTLAAQRFSPEASAAVLEYRLGGARYFTLEFATTQELRSLLRSVEPLPNLSELVSEPHRNSHCAPIRRKPHTASSGTWQEIATYLFSSTDYGDSALHVQLRNGLKKAAVRSACLRNYDCGRRVAVLLRSVAALQDLGENRDFFFVLSLYQGRDLPIFAWRTKGQFSRVSLIPDPLLWLAPSWSLARNHDSVACQHRHAQLLYQGPVTPSAAALFQQTKNDQSIVFAFSEPASPLPHQRGQEIVLSIEHRIFLLSSSNKSLAGRYLGSITILDDLEREDTSTLALLEHWKLGRSPVVAAGSFASEEFWTAWALADQHYLPVSAPDLMARLGNDCDRLRSAAQALAECVTDPSLLLAWYRESFKADPLMGAIEEWSHVAVDW